MKFMGDVFNFSSYIRKGSVDVYTYGVLVQCKYHAYKVNVDRNGGVLCH